MFRPYRFSTASSLLILLAIILLGSHTLVTAQQRSATTEAAQKTKAPFVLKLKKGPVISVSLQAKDARLSEIAAELSAKLKVPVLLSAPLHAQTVSLEFKDLTLEPALQLLSPQVFIDYQIDSNVQVPVGIFFSGYNEPEPALNAAVHASSQAMLIEGDTEDGVDPTTDEEKKKLEEKPLRIEYVNKSLTIRSKSQPLSFVTLRVGEELGIPVEIRDEPRDPITTEIVGLPAEEAIQRLSPNIRMYVRADLQRMERRLLRLVLMPSANSSQSSQVQP